MNWPNPKWVVRLMVGWAAVSMIWMVGVGANICANARQQASMSNDVAHDLDMTACDGANCLKPVNFTGGNNWTQIVRTYLQWDSVGIMEWTIAPPAAVLVLGAGAVMALRRRRPQRRSV